MSALDASPLTTTFDGLAFGWRCTGNSTATTVDINAISVTAAIQQVPEPNCLALAGGALALGLICRRRA